MPGGSTRCFTVGDQVLLHTKELLDVAYIGNLRPRWDGPFTVIACPCPIAYTLALPPRMSCSPTVNVDRLEPKFPRHGAPTPPGPVSDPGQQGEHEVELLLNRRRVRGVLRYLVRWRGHSSADDSWLRVEDLSLCAEKVAEYDAAAPRPRAARRGDVHSSVPAPVPDAAAPVAPQGFRFAEAVEVPSGASLVGHHLFYHWPEAGWVRGTVLRRSRVAGFSHVVRYGAQSALGSAVVDLLLDVASHGSPGR